MIFEETLYTSRFVFWYQNYVLQIVLLLIINKFIIDDNDDDDVNQCEWK